MDDAPSIYIVASHCHWRSRFSLVHTFILLAVICMNSPFAEGVTINRHPMLRTHLAFVPDGLSPPVVHSRTHLPSFASRWNKSSLFLFGGIGRSAPKQSSDADNSNASMWEAMKKTTEALSKLKQLQDDLSKKECVGKSGEGDACVTVTFSATGLPLKVHIDDRARELDAATLSELIKTAMVSAHSQVGELQRDAYMSLYKEYGLPIPPSGGGSGNPFGDMMGGGSPLG